MKFDQEKTHKVPLSPGTGKTCISDLTGLDNAKAHPPNRIMGSPTTLSPALRRGSFLFSHDEPSSGCLSARGTGTLSTLITRNRSVGSLLSGHGRDDEEVRSSGPGSAVADWGMVSHYMKNSWDLCDAGGEEHRRLEERRMNALLNTPQMRSMRLIGNSNPRHRWERYWKTDEELARMNKKIRRYYERTNYLIQQYLYIDRLLDSSLPHDLLNEYSAMPAHYIRGVEVPATITEEPPSSPDSPPRKNSDHLDMPPFSLSSSSEHVSAKRVKRTPRAIYRVTEMTPLFAQNREDGENDNDVEAQRRKPEIPWLDEEEIDSQSRIVVTVLYVNFLANAILVAGKIAVVISVPSVSVLASSVDAILDFLSTAIVWITMKLISRQDQYSYPVGRRRLEPLGILVFSVIMITSFLQVGLEAVQKLASPDHEIIQLTNSALGTMLSTIVIKGACWLWCRLVKNSSVQALAADASTDVIFNAGSIAFPIVGYYANIWWLDALGGLILSTVVIFNWSRTSTEHIKNLSGFSATPDQRNILIYLTLRFAKTIKQIQGLQAYHAGDKLNVEVDIVLDAHTSLKDSHDLSESLQYVIESLPIVDRAFVHVDYASYALVPTHLEQQARG